MTTTNTTTTTSTTTTSLVMMIPVFWPSVAIIIIIAFHIPVLLLSTDAASQIGGGGGGSTTTKSGQMGPVTKCTMSEYTCTNGKCIQMNKFCDNINDCEDGSDEPRFCTRCNRTYYGNLGITYDLELHRPKEDKIPYICELNFTAAGGVHGDIIQITFDRFTLGRFVSYTLDGCPDGYLQISEAARTPVGGMWCGASWGSTIFYSETRTLILSVKLLKLSLNQSLYNFDFKILYKVLPRESAVVRFGGIKFEDVKPWQNLPKLNKSYIDDFSNSTALYEHFTYENINYNSYSNNNNNNKEDYHHSHTYPFNNELNFNQFIEPKYYLGTLISGTHCSRIYSDCDKNPCRLQSPNYPGFYPRNLTCYFAVRQHEVPPGKHALITVRQPKGNLIWIQTQTTNSKKNEKEKFTPHINIWNECDNVQDYITIYDGYTTRDPVILKFCGGGDSVPAAISSGPEILVEFTTSPYGQFITSPNNLHNLNGFQLEVEVKFVDIQSVTYTKNKRLCEFWIRGTGHGVLENPKHSLAPNTTCLYHLQGTETYYRSMEQLQIPRRASTTMLSQPTRFKIWISILKFDLSPKFGGNTNERMPFSQPEEDCSGMLRIWDGSLREPPTCLDLNCEQDINGEPIKVKYGSGNSLNNGSNTNLIARYCYATMPKSCDHSLINETHGRPCTLSESFVSTGDFITLELKNMESTVLRPLTFKLRYEFVDLLQDGQPIGSEHDCHRKFMSNYMEKREQGIFQSSKNIFKFGRGGATNLKCIYRFEGQRDEIIRIVIKKIKTGHRKCTSKLDKTTNRSYCYGNSNAKLEIMEQPWSDSILFPRGCICNSTNSSDIPVVYVSTSKDLEIHFTAINMTAIDDPDNLYFEATYEFIKGPFGCLDTRKRTGPNGAISLAQEDIECRTRPWLIEPTAVTQFLYVRLNGIFLRKSNPLHKLSLNESTKISKDHERCETKSRIIMTNGNGVSITACPLNENSAQTDYVELFSAGWQNFHNFKDPVPSRSISIEYIYPDQLDYTFIWLEMYPRPPLGLVDNCLYRCPELDACVNVSVWCDGIDHCPSGYDESFTHCSALLRLPLEVLATICVLILVLFCCLILFIYRKIKKRCRGTSILQTRLKSLSSVDTATIDDKDVIC